MRKTCFILIAFILFVIFSVQKVYAIDLNLINSVRENEIDSAENLSLNTNINAESNNTVDDENITNNAILNNNDNVPSTNVSNVTSATDGTLTIGNILNILLVVVGVLLILLGIAILIRTKR